MRELRRIDVLLNEKTSEEFHLGDIVKVKTIGTYSIEYIGKLDWIETLELTLDMSKEYKCITKKIKYEDIVKIEKCD